MDICFTIVHVVKKNTIQNIHWTVRVPVDGQASTPLINGSSYKNISLSLEMWRLKFPIVKNMLKGLKPKQGFFFPSFQSNRWMEIYNSDRVDALPDFAQLNPEQWIK